MFFGCLMVFFFFDFGLEGWTGTLLDEDATGAGAEMVLRYVLTW